MFKFIYGFSANHLGPIFAVSDYLDASKQNGHLLNT